jgi:hypothetical protein
MNSNTRWFAVLGVAAAVGLVPGCANKQKTAAADEDTAQCKAFKGETDTVNKVCVMVNDDPVNPSVEPAIWKGQKIGFCCNGCKPRWAALTDAQKDAAVAKAVAMPAPK